MSILKGDRHEVTRFVRQRDERKRPYDHLGRMVPLQCPRVECGAGKLVYQGGGMWECDGLAAPDHDDKELELCQHFHQDGQPYKVNP